jgi:hypothetical protein
MIFICGVAAPPGDSRRSAAWQHRQIPQPAPVPSRDTPKPADHVYPRGLLGAERCIFLAVISVKA